MQPKVGIPFTATLSDEDGVVGDVKWQWYNDVDRSTATPPTNLTDDAAIAKAKSDTYTPKRADAADAP